MATFRNYNTTDSPSDLHAAGNRGQDLIATSGCMILLTTLAVTGRFVSRHVSNKVTFWWDDWCALAAWVLLIPQFAILIDSARHGIGRHQGTLSVDDVDRLGLDIFIGEIFYNTGLTATKYSALFFYVRVFPWTRLWFRIAIYTGFFLCTAWCIAITFMGSFQCEPVSRYWRIYESGHCLPTFAVNLGTSIPNVVIDTFILLIPMPFLKGLQVSLRQKVGVAVVFFAGYATLAISIARVVLTAQLRGEKLLDYSWNAVPFLEVVNLEPGIGLISVCLPAQVYLFRYVMTEVFGIHWSSIGSSLTTGRHHLRDKSKRSSRKIKSMIDGSKWRNLSNSTSNTSYQAQVYADLSATNTHTSENIQGIQVQTDVTVRPSSWAPQFVALILG